MCFWLGFDMAFVAKARQKMDTHCTPKSRNLELHLTMSVFLLAASLNFEIYWRALLSFPVLANTGSGKLWFVQELKVCLVKHPQGFREGGVRGGREWGHLRGKAPHLEIDKNVPRPLRFLLFLPPPPCSFSLTLSLLLLFFSASFGNAF